MSISEVFSTLKRKLENKEHTSSIRKLDELESLIYQGNTQELQLTFDQLRKINEIVQISPSDLKILEILILYELGEFQSGLEITKNHISLVNQSEDQLLELDFILLQTRATLELGDIDTSLNLIETGDEILLKIEGEMAKLARRKESHLYYLKARTLIRKADYDNALDLAQKALIITREYQNLYEIAKCLNLLGIIYNAKGNYQGANECFEEALKAFSKLDNKKETSKLFNNLGLNSWRIGNLGEALIYFKKCLALSEILDLYPQIAVSHLNIGLIYVNQGELSLALRCFQKCLVISEELNNKRVLSLCLNNMGLIFHAKGEFKQALKYFQDSLALNQELDNKHDIAFCYNNIGEVHSSMGKYNEALEQIEKALFLFQEIGAVPDITLSLSNLVDLSLLLELQEKANLYLQQLKDLDIKEENKLISQRYRLANALVMKSSRRAKIKIKSSEILEKLIKEEIIEHQLTIRAMFEYSELLIDELRAFGEEEVLYQIKLLIQRLDKIANKQNSYSLIIDTLILQAKLSMVEGKLNESQQYLDKAGQIADEKNIQQFASKVSGEKERLKEQYEKWEYLIQSNAPFGSRLEEAQVSEWIHIAKKAKREWGI